jgi:elongation factor G
LSSCANIRNFGIIAHIDAGKTTTTERILYLSGENYRIGEVDEGTTTTDWMEEERERGITIVAAAVSCKWNKSIFHLIDTPGHVDFTAEVQRSLRVLDGAVVVFCGVAGVQTQSETVWKQADHFKVPRIVFINKLDRAGADFEFVLNDITNKLKVIPVPLTIPYYVNDSLKGIIDVVKMKLMTFSSDARTEKTEDIPQSHIEKANIYREKLIDHLTSFDDSLIEKALDSTISDKEIIDTLRRLTIKREFVPVIAGSSLKNVGVPPLLDAIESLLPSPDDIGQIDALYVKKDKREPLLFDINGSPVVYIFKVQYHREKGPIAFVRIYAGKIENGDTLINPRTKKKERIQDLLRVYADKFERIESAQAGDIVTIVGLKNSFTGDTLCSEGHQVILEALKFPEPVIYIRIEPKNAIDREKLNTANQHLLLEDPTITCTEDKETGQTLIGGMGELHIEIFLDRIKKLYGISLNKGAPQVAYKETPLKKGEHAYEFDKKIEGNVQHAAVRLAINPGERSTGISIRSNLSKKDVHVLSNIEDGINSALRSGPESAYPVTDAEITIENISYDSSKTSPLALEAAANICTSELLRKLGTMLLEPIMKLEIDVPGNFTGQVIGEIQSRGGVIIDIVKKIDQDIIHAKAPLKVMFGYTTTLRSMTQGKGTFQMEFLEYDSLRSKNN